MISGKDREFNCFIELWYNNCSTNDSRVPLTSTTTTTIVEQTPCDDALIVLIILTSGASAMCLILLLYVFVYMCKRNRA